MKHEHLWVKKSLKSQIGLVVISGKLCQIEPQQHNQYRI